MPAKTCMDQGGQHELPEGQSLASQDSADMTSQKKGKVVLERQRDREGQGGRDKVMEGQWLESSGNAPSARPCISALR